MATSPATVGASGDLKAGVDRPDREEPRLNPSFREFARHYNVAVLPARSGQATDKAKVEAAVGAIRTRILLALRHETFFSLEAMNAAVRRELDPFNEAPMACGESRRAIFEANERDRTGVRERRGVNGRRGRFVHMRQDIAMPASVRVCGVEGSLTCRI